MPNEYNIVKHRYSIHYVLFFVLYSKHSSNVEDTFIFFPLFSRVWKQKLEDQTLCYNSRRTLQDVWVMAESFFYGVCVKESSTFS